MDDLISRQAAIAEFSCCELTPDGGIDANYAIDFLEQMPSVQPERWIPCSERLPEKNSEYLVTKVDHITDGLLLDIAYYGDWIQKNNGFHKADEVIAWMPLPLPYKGEQE